MEHPKVLLVDVNSSEYKNSQIELIKEAIKMYLLTVESDPFMPYPDILKRRDLEKLINRKVGWLQFNAIKHAALRTLGRRVDYATEIVEYRDENNMPYYKKKEIRAYYTNLIFGNKQ